MNNSKMMLLVLSLLSVVSSTQVALAAAGGDPSIQPPPPQIEQQVYQALKVEAVDVTAGRVGATTMQKKVGGLTCKAVAQVGPYRKFPKYSCELAKSGRNDKAIYEAMDVGASRVTSAADRFVDKKVAGNLSCTSTRKTTVRAVATYKCQLDKI